MNEVITIGAKDRASDRAIRPRQLEGDDPLKGCGHEESRKRAEGADEQVPVVRNLKRGKRPAFLS